MSDFLDKSISHNLWKSRLRDAIQGGEIPDEDITGSDNLCDIGKWIYGKGIKYQSLPEFQNLKSNHTGFHKAAANIIRTLKTGDKTKAMKELESGEFANISAKVILALKKLSTKIPK